MLDVDQAWREGPPYVAPDESFSANIKYQASCYCGAVTYVVNADPVSLHVNMQLCRCLFVCLR